MSIAFANISGLCAIFLWSSTALIFTYCADIPPIMLTAQTSLTAFMIFLIIWVLKGESINGHFRADWRSALFCTAGIGGYRLMYLYALGIVPVIDASLINYLWPVIIVILTQFLPDHKLKWHHIVGVILGFMGLVFLFYDSQTIFKDIQWGHIVAFFAALVWSGYSVLTRVVKTYSQSSVPVSFLYAGIILLIISLIVEPFKIVEWQQYLFMVLLSAVSGVGYFLWSNAMKYGSIQIMGVCSYLTPLFSTLLLVTFDKTILSGNIALATLFIAAGPLIASRQKMREAIAEHKALRRMKNHE